MGLEQQWPFVFIQRAEVDAFLREPLECAQISLVEQAMLAQVERAVKDGKGIVFLAWAPQVVALPDPGVMNWVMPFWIIIGTASINARL